MQDLDKAIGISDCFVNRKKNEKCLIGTTKTKKNVIGKKYIYKRLKKVLNKCKSISEKRRGLDLECSILNT